MQAFKFWQRWLFTLGLAIIFFGLILAFFNQAALLGFNFNQLINAVFWPSEKINDQMLMFQKWIYGVLGAVMAGWGVFIAFIAYGPFQRKEHWSWNCLLLGFILWYLPDTAISVYFKVYFNALINTFLFGAAILPLVLTRKHLN
jgi:hypothetical protein